MAKEFLKLDGPEAICYYTYDSNRETINAFINQLNNSDENVFVEHLSSPFDNWTIVVSSTSHDAAGIDFIVRKQLLMFNQGVSGV